MTLSLEVALAEAARGGAPPNVALMRFLGEAATEDAAHSALDRALAASTGAGEERLATMKALWAAHPQAWHVVRSVLAGASHAPGPTSPEVELGRWAAVFDRLAAAAPEAGVALYALGDPALLRAASDEVVGLARTLRLLGPSVTVLDFGCGIGRLSAALAPHVGNVLGLDLSSGMVEAARQRLAGLGNVRVAATDGRGLAPVPDGTIDLVLAADVMPYLVQAGGTLAGRHVAEFARVLRAGGAALVLNYSYRGDLALDRAELAGLAAAAGLRVERDGTRDLTLWDAPTFLLRRPLSP